MKPSSDIALDACVRKTTRFIGIHKSNVTRKFSYLGRTLELQLEIQLRCAY